MRKLFITCLSLLLICSAIQAHALSAAVQACLGAGGVSCTQSTVGTQDSYSSNIGSTARKCYCFQWIPATTQTIKRAYFEAFKTGTPTNNYSISILTGVSHGAAGTVISNGTSGTVAASSFSASPTLGWSYVTFSTAPSVTASSTYFVAICADTADDTNTIAWAKDNDGNGTTDNTGFYTTGLGSNWSAIEDHVGPVLWVTSCDEAKP